MLLVFCSLVLTGSGGIPSCRSPAVLEDLDYFAAGQTFASALEVFVYSSFLLSVHCRTGLLYIRIEFFGGLINS